MTSPQRHERVYQLFLKARDLDEAARSALLDQACVDDPSLRAEVEALLSEQSRASSFLEQSPVPVLPETKSGSEMPTSADESPVPDSRSSEALAKITIEGYDILRELHRGGQGVVFQAIQKSTKRKVAIKVLREGPFASKSAKKRFEREIELVAQLKHPNIIAVFDSGTTEDGWQYCAMDYIRGAQLHHHIHENKLTLEDTLKIFGQVCNAVQYAHHKGVIHRDLKPSNILVDSEGQPKVLDFGLAKQMIGPVNTVASITQEVLGTLPYMSPEQARGNPDHIDTRTDIYALGVILYEILTGHYPYPVAGQMVDVLRHIAETPPTPPSSQWTPDSGVTERSSKHIKSGRCPIDDELQTVIMKTLAKERERRYQSAGELGRDINHYLAGEPIDAKRDSGWYVFRKGLGRHKAKVGVVGAFLVVLLACGFYVQEVNAQRELDKAEAQAQKERDKAEIEAQKARDEQVSLITDLAIQYYGREQFDKAIEQCDTALEIAPNHYRAVAMKAYSLAQKYLKQKFHDRDKTTLQEAQPICLQAIELKPAKKHPMHNLMGMILLQLGDAAGAKESFLTALEYEPKYYTSKGNLAMAHAVLGEYPAALMAAEEGAELVSKKENTDEYDDEVYRNLGAIQLHLGRNEAVSSLTEAIELNSRDFRNALMLARMHLTLPGSVDNEQALSFAEDAEFYTELHDPRFHRILAQAALRVGQYERAAQHADTAIDGQDELAYCLFMGSIAKARMGDKDTARTLFEQAMNEWPAVFESIDVIVTADKGLLWFDTRKELEDLRKEAEQLISSANPS